MNPKSGREAWPFFVIGLVTIALGIYTIQRRKVLPGPHDHHKKPPEGEAAVRYGIGYIVAGIVMILVGFGLST